MNECKQFPVRFLII